MTKLLSHFLQKKGVAGMIGRWSDVSEKWDAPVWQPLYQESKKSCYGVGMEWTPCAKNACTSAYEFFIATSVAVPTTPTNVPRQALSLACQPVFFLIL